MQSRHPGWPEPQRRQRKAQRCAHLAAGRGHQRRQAGEIAFRGIGRDRVADARQQASEYCPARCVATGVGPEAGLVPRQQRNSGETRRQAQGPRRGRTVIQPRPCDQGREQRHGGIEHGRQSGRDRQQGERKKRERETRIEQADGEHWLPVPAQLRAQSTHQQQRPQKRGRNRHPGQRSRYGAEFDRRDAHEQERRTPDGGQQQEVGDPGAQRTARDGLDSRRQAARSSSSNALLRSSPPAYPVSEPSRPSTRWQGTTMLTGLRPTAAPTARTARGRPTRWLRSP